VNEVPSLGARGGGWVVIQFALMAAILVVWILGPRWPSAASWPLIVVGPALALTGVMIAVAAGRVLGSGLTPYPRPPRSGLLIEGGPYRIVRHPFYAGGTLFLAGLSVAFSPAALALTAGLAVVWALKAQVEERFLRAAYPEYGDYCERTRYRLLPYVY